MNYPDYRPRRLRKNDNFRRMIRETNLSADNLIYPLFAVPGHWEWSYWVDGDYHLLPDARYRRLCRIFARQQKLQSRK